MEKQKLIDEFKKIMDEYVIDEVGMTDTCIYADMLPDIAERLVNFLPIHIVSKRSELFCNCANQKIDIMDTTGYMQCKICGKEIAK